MIGGYPELAHLAPLLLGCASPLQKFPDPHRAQETQLVQSLENLDRPSSGDAMCAGAVCPLLRRFFDCL